MFNKPINDPDFFRPDDTGTPGDLPTPEASGVDSFDLGADELSRALAERDQARGDYLRALAEYQNYQRRALINEQEAKRQGVTSVVLSVVPVLDHFDVAISQSAADPAAQKIVEGVKVIRAELLRVLEKNGVSILNPRLNDDFDPTRHQAIAQQPADGVDPGRISETLQVGYALGDRVIRSAMVKVAP